MNDDYDFEAEQKKVDKVVKDYLNKRLVLLYDTICTAIYKDLLHLEYKDKIIKQTIDILDRIKQEKDTLTKKGSYLFFVNEMTVQILMRKKSQWSYWNMAKDCLEIQTFLASGDVFCDVITQDDFLYHLLYEVDFYYGLRN